MTRLYRAAIGTLTRLSRALLSGLNRTAIGALTGLRRALLSGLYRAAIGALAGLRRALTRLHRAAIGTLTGLRRGGTRRRLLSDGLLLRLLRGSGGLCGFRSRLAFLHGSRSGLRRLLHFGRGLDSDLGCWNLRHLLAGISGHELSAGLILLSELFLRFPFLPLLVLADEVG